MESGAQDTVPPCSDCLDPSLVQYEELQGGFVCIGCGAVLSQLMVSELASTRFEIDKGIQIGGQFVASQLGSTPSLSLEARRSATGRSALYSAPDVCHQRRRLHRLCQQLGLPQGATDETLTLALSTGSRRAAAETACVYTICRRLGRAISFSEVCAAAAVSRRQAGRCLRRLHAGIGASSPDRFVRRAVAVLGGSFDDERRSLALLQCLELAADASGAQHPDLTAYAAVVIVVSAGRREIGALETVAAQLGVKRRPLQDRTLQLKKVLLALAKVLPLGVVLTVGNVHLHYDLILDHLPLLADLRRQASPPTPGHDFVGDYEAAIRRFGPRTESPPPTSAGSDAGSDLESMSDDEARRYIRSEKEIQDFLQVQDRIHQNPFAARPDRSLSD